MSPLLLISPPVRDRVVPAGLDHPADLVADLPQAVVVERPDPRQQLRVVEQVGELRQRGHHAGGRVGVRAEPLAVVSARLREELAGGLVGERHGQLQRRPGAGRPVVFDQRADRAGDAGDEGVFADPERVAALQAVEVPARVGTEQLGELADAALGELAGALGAAVLHQRVQGVEPLAHVVGREQVERSADPAPVQRQGERAAVGEERGVGVLVDRVGRHGDAGGVLGVEQGVEMASGHVRLGVRAREAELRVGLDLRAEEGDVAVVGVEDVAHHPATKPDRAGQVGGVDVGQSHRPSSQPSGRGTGGAASKPSASRIVRAAASTGRVRSGRRRALQPERQPVRAEPRRQRHHRRAHVGTAGWRAGRR